jgi:hypothetical protein
MASVATTIKVNIGVRPRRRRMCRKLIAGRLQP